MSIYISCIYRAACSRRISCYWLVAVCGFFAAFAHLASAQVFPAYEWVHPGIESWHSAANWQLASVGGNGVPTAQNDAWIDNDGTARVTSSAEVHEVVIGRTGSGHLDVVGPLAVLSPEQIHVGYQGIGALSISDGAEVHGTGASIGSEANSRGSAAVVGADSTWAIDADLVVGGAGEGSLEVTESGRIENENALMGSSSTSFATATISGAGSVWHNAGTLTVARGGTAVLSISAGGSASSSAGIVGEQSGSLGSATVAGAGSTWTNSLDLSIGKSTGANGLLSLSESGSALANAIYLGADVGATGAATIDGAGSTLHSVDRLYVGHGGSGTISVGSGGQLESGSAHIGSNVGANGAITVDGVGSLWANHNELHIAIEGAGNVTVSGGAELQGGSEIVVGRGASGNGLLVVSGMGTQATTSGELRVADEGRGELRIEDGAHVSSGRGVLANNVADAVGAVLIRGAGSNWSLTAPLDVGRIGQGLLTLADGGSVTASGDVTIGPLGQLKGDGTIRSNVINGGVVAPGASPGTLHVEGNYTQNAEGSLQIGLMSPSNFDTVEITGSASLGGTLEIVLDEGYIPQGNPSFDVLDWGSRVGEFSSVILPTLGGTLHWDTTQLYSTGTISIAGESLLGDYNSNGAIDAADYVVWRDSLGQTGPDLAADGSGNDIVDQADYDLWRDNFGLLDATGADVVLSSTPSPEPTTALLLSIAGSLMWLTRQFTSAPRRD